MAVASKDRRIDEELVCADSLAHHLKHVCGAREVCVDRSHDDPPDFWFTIDGRRFAAEVMSIVLDQGYHADCLALKKEIAASCLKSGLLRGRYALVVKRQPALPKKRSVARRRLIENAASFISATHDVGTEAELPLLKNGRAQLSIEKVSSEGAAVGLFGPISAKFEGEIQDDLGNRMQAAVASKRAKLERKGIPDECPQAILLLYDAYGFGDLDDAQKALLKVRDYDWFHSVFWATSFTDRPNELSPDNPGRTGAFLYSRDRDWWHEPGAHQP